MAPSPSLDEFKVLFKAYGGTSEPYLALHYLRFIQTKERLLAQRRPHGNRLLDIGAHWLHQALLYAIDGFEVTALDLPEILQTPSVSALAQAHSIQLLPNQDLERPDALQAIPDNSFDLVLFTEIIEHITFNPVRMWREIYRVMSPGARVVITTPNYYALRSSLRRWMRALRRDGGSISVRDILSLKTLAHHWKEFSRRELQDYFRLLSVDFTCLNAAYTKDHMSTSRRKLRTIAGRVEHLIPPLRPGIYLEVELTRKERGITVEPHW